jgi:hypothetical protein
MAEDMTPAAPTVPDPVDARVMECPYPFYESLRRDAPVYKVPNACNGSECLSMGHVPRQENQPDGRCDLDTGHRHDGTGVMRRKFAPAHRR